MPNRPNTQQLEAIIALKISNPNAFDIFVRWFGESLEETLWGWLSNRENEDERHGAASELKRLLDVLVNAEDLLKKIEDGEQQDEGKLFQ